MRRAILPDSSFHRLAAAFELVDEPYYQAQLPGAEAPAAVSEYQAPRMEDVTEYPPEESIFEPDLDQIQEDITNLYTMIDMLQDGWGVSHEEISELKVRLDEVEADLQKAQEAKPEKRYLSNPGSPAGSDWEEYLRKNPYPYESR